MFKICDILGSVILVVIFYKKVYTNYHALSFARKNKP